MRTTRTQVESMFRMLTERTGHRIATSWNDVGGWALDYAPGYGGYVITEVANEHGGLTLPFGERRRSAGEMFSTMHFALRTIEAMEKVKA